MRTKLIVVVVALALPMLPAKLHAGVGISFGAFYSSLGAQGEWISVGAGEYAWHPAGVVVGWRPYTEGHWVWTDDGWFWVSDEPWGWATYHYGRWYYDDFYGWLWVPGYDWAPAWVEWRFGGGCVGWAPLCPYAVYRPGYGIYYRHRWETPHSYWSFVDSRHIGDPGVNRYVYRSDDNVRLIGRTRAGGSIRTAGGRIVTRGPDRTYVERTGNIRVGRAEIVDVTTRENAREVRTGGTGRLEVYRPTVQTRAPGATAERPERVREGSRAPSLEMQTTDLGVRHGERSAGAVRSSAPTPPQGGAQAPARREARRADQGTRGTQREAPPAPERTRGGRGERGKGAERRLEQTPAPPRGGAVERPRDRSFMAPAPDRGRGQAWHAQQPQRSVRTAEARGHSEGRGGARRSR